MIYHTASPHETENVGEMFSNSLEKGMVLAFRGDLGAGKTAFIRGLAKGLGYTGRVTSPTYAIVNEYEGGRLTLLHFDLYRLEQADELYDLGWEDYLARDAVCAVEWSERAQGYLPASTIYITISRGETDEMREIEIKEAAK